MLSGQMQQWVHFAREAAHKYGLDPAVVLGVIQVETSGNNIIGDQGHGRGLMQIDDRSHRVWLDAHDHGMDPETNIEYGCSLLRAGIDAFEGDLRAGIAAYDCGVGSVQLGIRESGDPDKYTTGRHYSTRVLGWAEIFQQDLVRVDLAGAEKADDIGGLIANYERIVHTPREQEAGK
jgi:soluble lytic murein transglycosylase-like protein